MQNIKIKYFSEQIEKLQYIAEQIRLDRFKSCSADRT